MSIILFTFATKILNDMNIFRKNTHTEPATEVSQPTEPVAIPEQQASPKTAEETARLWWKEHYGEAMPEDIVRWMKQLTRTEARRINIAQSMLSPQQISRIEDAQRLAETKLRNIETSLQRLHDQKSWVFSFNEKQHELTEHRNRLFEANKRIATLSNDEKALQRFETFESVQGLFQRMQVMEQLSHRNKQEQSNLARDMEKVGQQASDSQKRLQQLTDNRNEAIKQMAVAREKMEECNRILGARTILGMDERHMGQLHESVSQQKMILGKEMEELEAELDSLQNLIAQQSTERQTMEPHQNLMEHGEMILTQLNRLYEISTEQDSLSRKQEEATKRQQEENNMLNRVFSDYQHVESDIKRLNDELFLHRQQNLGRSSYKLQERATQQKGRRQMLISAQSLWHRIQSGYKLIEEKTQEVNRLRLSIGNLRQKLEEQTNKVMPMRQLCHDKEYTLTLSKSQNVIQLRGDLKEGVSCTVCGATHHPYHSETMLEQSKLIGELRTDFELLQAELASNERQLLQLQTGLATEEARYETEEHSLSQLRNRQMEDVKEWDIFAPLDRSLNECSASTNAEARTAMLRQLIENAEREVDIATKELDEYNFHQTRINEIAEELTRKEQYKNDLTLRLNEVNTGCQVMAQQVENYRQLKAANHELYSHLYEKLDKWITLGDWYGQWQKSHEGLRQRIIKMLETWQRLNASIPQLKQQQERVTAVLEEKRMTSAYLDALLLQIRDFNEKQRTLCKEGEKTYEKLLGKQEVKDFFDANYQQLLQAKKEEEEQRDSMHEAREQLAAMTGRRDELVETCNLLDAETAAERSRLDVWMRQFNANHPPVQYAELERAFDTEMDWNAIREQVRGLRIEAMLEQARVDALRSAIVALQAEGIRPSTENTDEAMASIVAQQKQLEKQRQEVLMQLAEQRIALHTHEQCVARLKAEEEEL